MDHHAQPQPQNDAMPWRKVYPDWLDWDMALTETTLGQMFDRSVERFAERPALEFLGRRYRYAEMGAGVERAAGVLNALGVKPGDCVGLNLPNCHAYVFYYYAVMKLGAVAVSFNPRYPAEVMAKFIDLAAIKLMVTLDLAEVYPTAAEALERSSLERLLVVPFTGQIPTLKGVLARALKRSLFAPVAYDQTRVQRERDVVPIAPNYPQVLPQDTAALQFTGGTTGLPKMVELSHANLTINCQQVASWFHKAEEGKGSVVAVLPFFHVFAMTACLNFMISKGMEIIMLPKYEKRQLLSTIKAQKPTFFVGVPTLYNALSLDHSTQKSDWQTLEYCVSGGAALPAAVAKRFAERYGIALTEGYGLSETAPIVAVNPTDRPVRVDADGVGTIGLPVPGTRIRIVSSEDRKTVLPAGERGEVCIEGPQVFQGYRNNPDATAHALQGRRFHTGDVGYMDEDGFTYLVDRIDDMIVASGFNVYPRDIEEHLNRHDAVAECAVYGFADSHRGQIPIAAIVLQPGQSVTAEALRDFLSDKLAAYQVPSEFEFLDELPKSVVGKLLKKDLRAARQARAT